MKRDNLCNTRFLCFIFSDLKPDNKADAILVWAPNIDLHEAKSEL